MKRLLAHLAALTPFAYLVYFATTGDLGANPAETIIRSTGDWAVRFICAVLLVTPLRETFKLRALASYRRMIGLYAFFYTTIHLLAYAGFDQGFELVDIYTDIIKRPFIAVGMIAWVGLLALAATSFNRVIKRMGAKSWKALHKSVYAIAVLAIVHFFLMRAGKNNFGDVILYGSIIGALLTYRVVKAKAAQ